MDVMILLTRHEKRPGSLGACPFAAQFSSSILVFVGAKAYKPNEKNLVLIFHPFKDRLDSRSHLVPRRQYASFRVSCERGFEFY